MNPKIPVSEKAITAFTSNLYTHTLELANRSVAYSEREHKEDKMAYLEVKKVMVADDDPATIDVVTLMLETAGYKVYSSANRQTIPDVIRLCPDLILLDILMSGANGCDICKKLKKQKATKHIPIIIISANIHATEIASHACADDFINKPFEMRGLLQKWPGMFNS